MYCMSHTLTIRLQRYSVITVDRTDFGVYRRNKRDVIPIVCPP